MEHLSYVDDFFSDGGPVEGACLVIFFICTFETKPFWTGICNLVVTVCVLDVFLTTTSTISQIFFCLQKKQKITKATISTCVLSVWGQCVQHLHIDEPPMAMKNSGSGGSTCWSSQCRWQPVTCLVEVCPTEFSIFSWQTSQTHTIHVWYIYSIFTYIWLFLMVKYGKCR